MDLTDSITVEECMLPSSVGGVMWHREVLLPLLPAKDEPEAE